jgi:hypothetical protein
MMRANAAGICLGILLAAASSRAQNTPPQTISSTQAVPTATSPDYTAVYCANFISADRVPDEMRLISGEESYSKVIFARGDYVFLNKGSAQGVHIGDVFSVVRVQTEPTKMPWFKWQEKLTKAMGTYYKDAGQLRVVDVHPNVSTAQVTFSCDYMQRGDIVRPMQERPTPPYKAAEKFDRFAPVSGKPVGMFVYGQEFSQLYGKNSIVYLNLGSAQGVKVGDYVRAFRYQGSLSETAPNTKGYQYELFGFGSTPVKYEWKDLPREILGEGIVTYTTANASTVFITYDRVEMYAGDYAEIE